MLESLACVREVATAVEESQRSNVFGHLVILLRDVEIMEEAARSVILDPEEFEGTGQRETQEANEHRLARTATRECLKQSFESIKVFCMPMPHDDIGGTPLVKNEEAAHEPAPKGAVDAMSACPPFRILDGNLRSKSS